MDDNVIREKLAAKFHAHTLPRSMPDSLHPSTLEGFEPIEGIVGEGKICCVCDETITVADKGALPWGALEYRYPDGRCYVFHRRCEELWREGWRSGRRA